MPTSLELLERFKPHLVYDTQEGYFADAADEWTDAPPNRLERADRTTVIAAATPAAGQPRLSLATLSSTAYPGTDQSYRKGDVIGCTDKDYAGVYRDLRVLPGYRNVVYGRMVAEQGTPRWLQYWLFYFYNPAPAKDLGVGYGAHEGDWEMVQLRLGDDGRPDQAAFCQHKGAEVRGWADVEKTGAGDTPVVYVARASHAAYFEPVHLPWERADGGRPAPPLALVDLTVRPPAWTRWRGAWGDTQPQEVLGVRIGESSPGGPVTHRQWADPASLLRQPARVTLPVAPAPMPPVPEVLTVRREGGHAKITYAFAGGDRGSATGLLVTLSSPDDKYPPLTDTVAIEAGSGTVTAPARLDARQRYVVAVSSINDQGATSRVLERTLSPGG